MKALVLITILQFLRALEANPIALSSSESSESNEEDFQHSNDEVDLGWRLPKSIYPISYQIELNTRVHENGIRDYTGSVIISCDVREETNRIILHVKELNILDVFVFEGLTPVDPIMYYEDETRDFLIIQTLSNFQPGSDLSLRVEFGGQLRLEGVGFYRSEYKVDGETRYLAATQFEANYARYAFPVFDGM